MPWRILVFAGILLAGLALYAAADGRHWWDGLVMAFDAAAAVFLILLVTLVSYAGPEAMRLHAEANDGNRRVILVLTTVVALAVLGAIGGELPGARHGDVISIAKLIGTLLLVWLFANSVFTLHYAHSFYTQDTATGDDARGIAFPGTESPTYSDFAYFAFTLGMTFQTSDVEIETPHLRRAVLLHCFGAFVFNIGVIAFAINALGGAF